MEALQPVGSFKIRGIGRTCQLAAEAGIDHLVSSSGGNAGYAVAYAGDKLGLKVTVVVPSTTSAFMRDLLTSRGAEVIEFGKVWDRAHAHAQQIAEPAKARLIHPFEGESTWDGHATLIEELVEQTERPASIVLSVGGGGLLCGIIRGLIKVGWENVPVLAVETIGADSLLTSLEAGKLVTLPEITSIAKTLGASTVSPTAFQYARTKKVTAVRVTDAEAVNACANFATDHKLFVEPACGAALATAYTSPKNLPGKGPVVIIVCGGAAATPALLK